MSPANATSPTSTSVFDGLQARRLDGQSVDLGTYTGRPALVVNVASQCGFTPQYAGLQTLHEAFASRGVAILAFPCNQFGHQEPGDSAQIGTFCAKNYGVAFPVFEKVEVNGEHAHPLFQRLKAAAPGVLGTEGIKWNFTKFLVDAQGRVVSRHAPTTRPEELSDEIEALLRS